MKLKHQPFFAILFLLLTISSKLYFAQTTYTWTGDTGDWNISSNWSPNGIPGAGDFIIVKHGELNTKGIRTIAGLDFSGNKIILDSSGATLTITDSANLSGGALDSGKVIVAKTAVMVINRVSLKGGITLVNDGIIRFEGPNGFYIFENSILENNSLFDITNDVSFGGGDSGGTFINNGILRKSKGDGASTFSSYWNFKNQNSDIEVLSGTLKFNNNGTFTGGTYFASTGSTLWFRLLTHIFNDTLSGIPLGTIKFTGGFLQAGSNGATLNFGGTGFQFSGGSITGGGTLTNSNTGLVVLNTLNLKDSSKLVNEGIIRFEGPGGLNIFENSILENNSLFDITNDAIFTGAGNGGIFNNNGILQKSSGNGVTFFSSYFNVNNQTGGFIKANSGKLRFANLVNKTNAVIQGNATIDVPDIAKFTDNGITSPGESVGQLLYLGDYIPTSSSVLKIELGGQAEYDQLAITGKAVLNGTLEVSLVNSFVPAVGDTFVILTTSKTVTDSFTTIIKKSGLDFTVKNNLDNVTISINSITGIEDENKSNKNIPTKFELSQNYPNPFNPTTTISYSIPNLTHPLIPSRALPIGRQEGKEHSERGVLQNVQLKVYDILGKEVATLVNKKQTAGSYKVTFDASSLSSGIYFYRLTTGGFVETKKMILLQ